MVEETWWKWCDEEMDGEMDGMENEGTRGPKMRMREWRAERRGSGVETFRERQVVVPDTKWGKTATQMARTVRARSWGWIHGFSGARSAMETQPARDRNGKGMDG